MIDVKCRVKSFFRNLYFRLLPKSTKMKFIKKHEDIILDYIKIINECEGEGDFITSIYYSIKKHKHLIILFDYYEIYENRCK